MWHVQPAGRAVFDGTRPIATGLTREIAEQIVREHNAHERLVAACVAAYPIVAAMCNTLGETCPPDDAEALGKLQDVLTEFSPQE